ncbi:unnamed protein product [Miscanthus lutarioriparius]|uniref:Retrotransposon gag domain-containing protein n=1 Tax=Miscanthus lutarioriparius TaxID=422564 RepID=A0A811NYU1_9POAL|nr:unnamed protein product [Miscanthus lutarioriparius]
MATSVDGVDSKRRGQVVRYAAPTGFEHLHRHGVGRSVVGAIGGATGATATTTATASALEDLTASSRGSGASSRGSAGAQRAGSEPCSKSLAAPICVERGATAQRALHAWRGGVGTLLATAPLGLWRDQCEMYFEVYVVHPALKTRCAALNFIAPVSTWLQTMECRGCIVDWSKLCELVFAKYDKDQYSLMLRQLDALKQSGSVTEYQHHFEELAHGIILYNPVFDDSYLVTRFLGGLREEIRSAITLHRPKDVDTASALALLQEEELENARKKITTKDQNRHGFRPFTPADKPKAAEPDKLKLKPADDKLGSLKAYRRQNGLCFRCGEKSGPGLEELLDALDDESSPDSLSAEESSELDGVLAIGDKTDHCQHKRKTMRLSGFIGSMEILILVDSGSVGSFISSNVAAQLKNQLQDCQEAQYVTADVSPMVCSKRIPNLTWSTQGHTFTSSVGVLPLRCYDMILGVDWLEHCSPMWVHWTKKIMRFMHNDTRITLRGVRQEVTKCSAVSAGRFKGLLRRQAATHCI